MKIINGVRVCGNEQKWCGAVCIIDNPHKGRAHFGPDKDGNYREWGTKRGR